jgi:ATP-dependent DNA helicase RecG
MKSPKSSLISMSATPIPRSLALTLYGDMEISIIKQKPAGRKEIETLIFPENRKGAVYNSFDKYMEQGRQIYIVLPLIEEDEDSELRSVEEYHKELIARFPERRIAALHGQLDNDEKRAIMETFSAQETDILVSTTVIEVGIDVPNANVIMIVQPERFGLAQLHQLRGRVGRGEHQSFCVLLHGDEISQKSRKRLEILAASTDGFFIAEKDLELRGSGEVIGKMQSGFKNELTFADIFDDQELLEKARSEAELFIEEKGHLALEKLIGESSFFRIIS